MSDGATARSEARATRIVMVEDHTLVRQSLIKTVAAEGFDVVGDAGRGDDAIRLIGELRPDVVVLDVGLPGGDGLDVASAIRRVSPATRVIFLSMHDDDATVRRAIGLGADGYVLKSASTDDLLRALRAVADGGSYLSPAIARRILELAGRDPAPGSRLTERELEILHLLVEGLRPAQVAARLYLSVKTVKNHLTNVYTKMGVETGAQAVAEAYRRGLVSAVR